MITLDAADSVVNTPSNFIETISEFNYAGIRGEIAPPSLLRIIEKFTDRLEHSLVVVKKMSRKEAILALSEIKPGLPGIIAKQEKFDADYGQVYSHSVIVVRKMFDAINAVAGEIIYISKGRKINEDTPEYEAFLFKFIKEGESDRRYAVGVDEVLALFD